ncbi:coenzyme F420-0:L-glutamate ligase [Humibacillus xanthopallidus]|uniref:coenzyme F420-0:L-glutamate ligase n=1 Tax=Humibacillus xanthopallidus TaxID=412689 RepID=UPI00384EC630
MNGTVTLTPLHGIPEVCPGDDLADLLDAGLRASGLTLLDGDVVVVSSKVASKALGLVTDDVDRERVVAGETDRVVAERRAGDRLTRIVKAKAGPVMAAAGVDGSNTGERGGLLLLPHDPDQVCEQLHDALTRRHGVRLGVVLSDTAGRPWRVGQVDFALGAHGLHVLDDLRGGVDADGRDLSVTARALADEIAAAADLVKGKVLGVPAAVVRGLTDVVVDDVAREVTGEAPDGAADEAAAEAAGAATDRRGTPPGARDLVRTGRDDWFGHGRVEAVRAALGAPPGSDLALEVGIPPVGPETRAEAVARAVRLALALDDEATADVGEASVTLGADSPYELGRLVARLQAALWCDGLAGDPAVPAADGCSVVVQVTQVGPVG